MDWAKLTTTYVDDLVSRLWNIRVTNDHGYIPRKHFPILSSFTTYYRVCNQINTTGAISGAVTAYPSGAPGFTPGFQWGSCYSIFSFICMFCRSLFVLLYCFFWPLCCMFFFDIRILIAPLVSSNSSRPPLYSNYSIIYDMGNITIDTRKVNVELN